MEYHERSILILQNQNAVYDTNAFKLIGAARIAKITSQFNQIG